MPNFPRQILAAYEKMRQMSIAPYTVCLYVKIEEDEIQEGRVNSKRFRPLGTGVLITYRGSYFLLSASHVYEGLSPDKVGIYIKNQDFYPILYGGHESSDYGSDLFAGKLLSDSVRLLQSLRFSFLDESKLSFDHTLSNRPEYVICGFPGTNNYAMKRKLFGYSGALTNSNDGKLYMEFHREKSKKYESDTKATTPLPPGISGCGIWCIKSLSDHTLVGLATDYSLPESYLKGTPLSELRKVLDGLL